MTLEKEIGEVLTGFIVAFVAIVLSNALPSPQIYSGVPALIVLNIALGLIVPLVLFVSDIEDAVRASYGYCLGLLAGGIYYWAYVSFSWYAVQVIVEGGLALGFYTARSERAE
jgi:hypothetical protein